METEAPVTIDHGDASLEAYPVRVYVYGRTGHPNYSGHVPTISNFKGLTYSQEKNTGYATYYITKDRPHKIVQVDFRNYQLIGR